MYTTKVQYNTFQYRGFSLSLYTRYRIKSNINKTVFVTQFGMFKFLRLPFGLRNAGNTFQGMMDQILGKLPNYFVYINDILIFSPNFTSHIQDLRDVLELCRAHGLTIGLGKCEFAVPETEFLGHCLTSSSLHPLPSTSPPFKIFLQLWINPDFRGS